jgi:MoaA/NifB/PqqE/SkfB family radical SAM enzyme
MPDHRSVDVIWNMTLVCPYDCAVCCVDAVHVTRRRGRVELRSQASRTVLPRDTSGDTIYEQAGRFRQRQGLELKLARKLEVLDNLSGFAPRIDFSGGDVLVLAENVDVISEAARRFGRDAITITATGAGVGADTLAMLPSVIGHFNFTFDSVQQPGGNRPPGYASSNLAAGRRLAANGVRIRAELPLTRTNCGAAELTHIYETLRESDVEQILLMRLFPVGRGADQKGEIPSRAEYLAAIEHLRDLERRYDDGPRVQLQCALRHLAPTGGSDNPCNAVTTSFGITPDGTLLRSAWAIDRRGRPLHPSWILGNVADTSLARILSSSRVARMRERADENHGHCKVFAFLNGRSAEPADRFYERTDPLYT